MAIENFIFLMTLSSLLITKKRRRRRRRSLFNYMIQSFSISKKKNFHHLISSVSMSNQNRGFANMYQKQTKEKRPQTWIDLSPTTSPWRELQTRASYTIFSTSFWSIPWKSKEVLEEIPSWEVSIASTFPDLRGKGWDMILMDFGIWVLKIWLVGLNPIQVFDDFDINLEERAVEMEQE